MLRVGVVWLACAALPGAAAADNKRPAVGGGAPRRAKRGPAPSPLVQAVAINDIGLSVVDYSYEDADPLVADAVEVEVHACALNAGDVQQLRGAWGTCLLPLVPGREAVGVVLRVGKAVKGIAPGDRVGVLLGTGMDSEDVENGSDRNRLDFATTGAAAHRIRVAARWAFPLPAGIPTQHAAGALGSGGAIWQQLKKARLPKGAKVGIVGGGTAAGLAEAIAAALGYETHTVVGTYAAAVAYAARAKVKTISGQHTHTQRGGREGETVRHTHMRIHRHHTHTRTHARAHTRTHAHTYRHHTHTRARAHTHIQHDIHTHTHTERERERERERETHINDTTHPQTHAHRQIDKHAHR